MSKYRYGNLMVVVTRIGNGKEPGKDVFTCKVRAFGYDKSIPRKDFIVEAISNAQAARMALDKYNRKVE